MFTSKLKNPVSLQETGFFTKEGFLTARLLAKLARDLEQ